MNFSDIRPFVRFCQTMQLSGGWKQGFVRAYDHRMFLVLTGSGTILTADSARQLSPGVLLYWPSGTSYRLIPDKAQTLELIGINFDFTQEHSSNIQYLPMASENEYSSEERLEDPVFPDAACFNGFLYLENQAEIGSVLQKMAEETRRPNAFGALYLSSLMTEALTLTVRQADKHRIQKSSVRNILDFVHTHFSEPLTNVGLGARFGYHPNYIAALVRRHTGLPLHRYLLKLRIDRAVLLLSSTDRPVSEIAAEVGFRNDSYFSHYFRKLTGYPPSALRISD